MGQNISSYFLWKINPVMISFWGIDVYYYGVLFIIGFFLGYLLWYHQMVRGGHNREIAYYYFFWAFIATVVGARLGEVLFYGPGQYLDNPMKILMVHKGGLSSHGATIGLLLSLYLYSLRYKYSFIEIVDRFAMSPLMAAIFVRLGNFVNGEIVGREWYGPIAVRFYRHEAHLQRQWEALHGRLNMEIEPLPRHPSQLYEALGALAIFIIIYLIDRRLKEKRPRGLICGMFFLGYFTFRFIIEFFKDFQTLSELNLVDTERVIRTIPTSPLTMGQYLSIPFALLGLFLIVWSFRKRLPAADLSSFDKPEKEEKIDRKEDRKKEGKDSRKTIRKIKNKKGRLY